MKNNKKEYHPWQMLVRMFKFSKLYYRWYFGLAVLTIFSSITGVLMAESYRRMINGAVQGDLTLIQTGLLFAIALMVLSIIFGFVDQYAGPLLDHISTRRFSLYFLKKLNKLSLLSLKKYHSGELITRSDDAVEAQTNINNLSRNIIHNTFTIFFMFIYLNSLNSDLTLKVFFIAIIGSGIIIPFSRYLRSLYDERFRAIGEKNSFLQDMAQGVEVVRTFSLASRLEKKYKFLFEEMLSYIKKSTILEALFFHSHLIVIISGGLFVLYYGGLMTIGGSLDIGALVAFLVSFEMIVGPLSAIFRVWPDFQKAISKANRVFEILDLEEEDSTLDDSSYEKKSAHFAELDIRDLCFSYAETEVLKGVSFTVNKGEVTAIVGPSGSGKSTLLRLLLYLYEPTRGEIIFCGYPLTSIPRAQWRERIAYVSQDPCIFSGSFYDNIIQGRLDAESEEVEEAARQAGIHDFIISTPDAYDSQVGERGIRLSGGERQRIAIARALLKNPELLILDEPTASLDSENELLVQEVLEKLMKGRTTIVVAHRLSTIRDADKIIFLEDGTVQEIGNHNSLLEKGGKYYRMYFSREEGAGENGSS